MRGTKHRHGHELMTNDRVVFTLSPLLESSTKRASLKVEEDTEFPARWCPLERPTQGWEIMYFELGRTFWRQFRGGR